MLDDKKIRKIVQEELKKADTRRRFGMQTIPLHSHNGKDSPNIKVKDLEKNPAVMGQVDFATSGVDYTFKLNLPFTPSHVTLNGYFVDSTTAPTVRYHVWGEAYLGDAYYLQPVDNRTVAVGGIPYPAFDNLQDGSKATIPVQSSTFFGHVNGSTNGTVGGSQFHIADVYGSATLRVTVVDFSKDKIVFRVTSLSSGYTLVGNYLIT